MNASRKVIKKVNKQMMKDGWCVIDCRNLLKDLREYFLIEENVFKISGYATVSHDDGAEVRSEFIDEKIKNKIKEYGNFIDTLLKASLPNENLNLIDTQIRCEKETMKETYIDDWHQDGGYVRCISSLYGPGTEVLSRAKGIHFGNTLIMSAIGRGKQLNLPITLHRRRGGRTRAILVSTFGYRFNRQT